MRGTFDLHRYTDLRPVPLDSQDSVEDPRKEFSVVRTKEMDEKKGERCKYNRPYVCIPDLGLVG